jgi:hypothetical protein
MAENGKEQAVQNYMYGCDYVEWGVGLIGESIYTPLRIATKIHS